MAVGWKSLAGIVGAASVVCVGTLYSVLVREPSTATPPATQTDATPRAIANPPAAGAPQTLPAGQDQAAKPGAPQPDATKPGPANPVAAKTQASAPADQSTQPDAAKPGTPATNASQVAPAQGDNDRTAKGGQVLPTFDIARIEPSGDAVIAGRAAPGATVELLRNGNVYARAVADLGGQWAIVPPTLPKGPCELTLRTTSPDGRVAQSEQTVSVRVPEQPGEEVVSLLNAPDQPSKVLTDAARPTGKPVANSQVAAAPPTQAAPSGNGPTVANPSAPTPNTPKADAAKTPSRANASIRTVEADENGRFFVTGMAEPGATLRIYLNDTLVTTVTAAKDGSFGMTIEKGMSPGDYHVRVDDVATGTGQVLTRAEVPFAMAEKTPTASAPAVVAAATSPGKPAAPGAAVPASTSLSATTATRGMPGTTTPQQVQPASVQAPAAASSTAVPVASATDNIAIGDKTAPAATAVPAQGASPATTANQQQASASASPSAAAPAQIPATATQSTPGAQPVQVGEAKPAAATPPPSVAVIPEIRTTTIVQGDNLWRISRKIYGQGIRYTWIYDANTDQIRNPNMIYPGQIFVMPDKKEP